MPVYEYRCKKGHQFEVIQRMSSEPISQCEVCGAAAERVLFAPAIHFKGTGFHNTDYGSRKRGLRDGEKSEGATVDSAKPDGATVDSAKPDGAKPDGAKPDGVKSDGETKQTKEATPKDTAARTTGP